MLNVVIQETSLFLLQCSVYSSLPFYELETVNPNVEPPKVIIEMQEREKMAQEAAQKLAATKQRVRLRSIAPLLRSRINIDQAPDSTSKRELRLPNVVSGMIATVRLKKMLEKQVTHVKETLARKTDGGPAWESDSETVCGEESASAIPVSALPSVYRVAPTPDKAAA